MTGTISKTIEIAGVEIGVEAEFSADFVDNGFDHAFGTEHCWEWEIDETLGMVPDEDVREVCMVYIQPSMFKNRRKYIKALRRKIRAVELAISRANVDDYFDNDELVEACGDAPERDCEPDEDYERYYENKYDQDYRE